MREDFTEEDLAWFRRPLPTVLLVLAAMIPIWSACVSLPHVPPKTRTQTDAQLASVHINVYCFDSSTVWGPPKRASGVIVSERHVLTVAHAVRCPAIPAVYATLADGRVFKMAVTRDDAMFGSGKDLARLEIATAERFGVNIAPPTLGEPTPGKFAGVVFTDRTDLPGVFHSVPGYVSWVESRPGESGSGVYNTCGELVGIVSGTGDEFLQYERVDASWLEGT